MATYALVPGGGGDPWEWHRLVPQLEARGHEAIAVRLPAEDEAAGWSEYAEAVIKALGHRSEVTHRCSIDGGFHRPDRLLPAHGRFARPAERHDP